MNFPNVKLLTEFHLKLSVTVKWPITFVLFVSFAVASAVPWEEWWTYEGISGKLIPDSGRIRLIRNPHRIDPLSRAVPTLCNNNGVLTLQFVT